MTLFGKSVIVISLTYSAILAAPHFGQQKIVESDSTDRRGGIVERLPDPCYLNDIECDWKFTAPVTKYIDTGTMASGKQTYIGAVACPRKYQLGQIVEIDGKQYTCEDRTHYRLDGRFDIFTDEPYEQAMRFGKQHLSIYLK